MRKIVYLLILTVLLAACGGTPSNNNNQSTGDGPDVAARNWFTAYFNADVDAVVAVTCAAQADAIREGAEALAGVAAAAEYDLSGVTFSVTEQTDTTATVSASGNISVTAAGQTVEQDIGASGVQPVITLVREDNAWKVCP